MDTPQTKNNEMAIVEASEKDDTDIMSSPPSQASGVSDPYAFTASTTIVFDRDTYTRFKRYCRKVLRKSVREVLNDMIREKVSTIGEEEEGAKYENLKLEFLHSEKRWKDIRRTIPHIDIFKAAFDKYGGDIKHFTNAKQVVGQIFRDLATVLPEGTECPVCKKPVEEGHLESDMLKFETYVGIRTDHQHMREKLHEMRNAQGFDASQDDSVVVPPISSSTKSDNAVATVPVPSVGKAG